VLERKSRGRERRAEIWDEREGNRRRLLVSPGWTYILIYVSPLIATYRHVVKCVTAAIK
jgi:hypothetical protein